MGSKKLCSLLMIGVDRVRRHVRQYQAPRLLGVPDVTRNIYGDGY
jgi:hypothetical protein